MHESRLAEEIAAELQIALPKTVFQMTKKLKYLKKVHNIFQNAGMVRVLKYKNNEPIKVMGISTHYASIPAFGGIIYGVSALGVGMVLDNKKVIDSWRISRVEIKDMDFISYHNRLKWIAYHKLYEILEEVMDADNRPELILTDMPLIISRREMSIAKDDEVESEWNAITEKMNSFWKKYESELYPRNPLGIKIAGMGRGTSAIFNALKEAGIIATPDPISEELIEFLHTDWNKIRKIGQYRVLFQILKEKNRTIAFLYDYIGLDPRSQPDALIKNIGVMGFYLQAHNNTKIWQLEFPGSSLSWNSEKLDALGSDIINITLFDNKNALPLPLWYANQSVQFSKEFLNFYKKAVLKDLKEKYV